MARPEDIPEPTRTAVTTVECPRFETHPFIKGPPLSQRRIAIISSAALIKRGEVPFHFGSTDYRTGTCQLSYRGYPDKPCVDQLRSIWIPAGHQRSLPDYPSA